MGGWLGGGAVITRFKANSVRLDWTSQLELSLAKVTKLLVELDQNLDINQIPIALPIFLFLYFFQLGGCNFFNSS